MINFHVIYTLEVRILISRRSFHQTACELIPPVLYFLIETFNDFYNL